MSAMPYFNQFAENIWTSDQELVFLKVELGARMTVVRLTNGDLFVHSPIRPSDELVNEIKELGEVKYVVAPNRWHHLYVKKFAKYFSSAQIFGAPGLDSKRKDIEFDEIIDEEKTYPWSQELDQFLVKGAPLFNEVVFLHKATKTLIVTDLGMHICEDSPFLTRLAFTLLGNFNKYGWAKIDKYLFIKNRPQFRASMAKILNWDFDKIILSHGVLIEKNAKEQFKRAFENFC